LILELGEQAIQDGLLILNHLCMIPIAEPSVGNIPLLAVKSRWGKEETSVKNQADEENGT
jgi:hypothetical protein